MPTNNLNLTIAPAWGLTHVNSGFQSTSEGPDSTGSFSLTGLSTTQWNQALTQQYTLTSGQSQTIDLMSGTNLLSENYSFGHVLCNFFTCTGGPVIVGPAGTSGGYWFFGSGKNIIALNDGGAFGWSDKPSVSGTLIASGASRFTITAGQPTLSGASTVATYIVFGTTS